MLIAHAQLGVVMTCNRDRKLHHRYCTLRGCETLPPTTKSPETLIATDDTDRVSEIPYSIRNLLHGYNNNSNYV